MATLMKDTPTLLVGLGGIGSTIVDILYSGLSEEQREYIGAIGCDTNKGDLDKLKIKTVQTSDERLVKDFMKTYPQYGRWFPVNKFTANRGMLKGAGQIRAISRLALIASMEAGKFITVEEEIKRILAHNGSKDISTFNIFVICSITGGTGAGMFLQIPFYLRNLLREQFFLENVTIRGMFMNADITKKYQPNKINRDSVMVNAYACMKELNAFFLTQVLPDEENRLELEFYTKSDINKEVKAIKGKFRDPYAEDEIEEDEIYEEDEEELNRDLKGLASDGSNVPYNAVYIIEATDNSGAIGDAALEEVQDQMAKMIYTLLFTPVKAKSEGTLDNSVLADMESGGMNRYNSAGLCVIQYPYKKIEEYIALCWIKELVKEEWLLIDNDFEVEKRGAMKERKSDPMADIPEISEAYVKYFEEETFKSKQPRLAYLFKDVFIENEKKPNDPISAPMQFLSDIDAEIDNLFENDINVKSADTDCKVNLKQLTDVNNADRETERVYGALDKYHQAVIKVFKQNKMLLANEIFPISIQSMGLKKDKELNIFNYLRNIHPVSARYFCYQMVLQLRNKIEETNESLEGLDLKMLENVDFYGTKEDGIQSATEAVAMIRSKSFPIIRTGRGNLKNLAGLFPIKVKTQREIYLEEASSNLRLQTYRILLKRFEILSDFYAKFFGNIEVELQNNEQRLAILENGFTKNPYGKKYVYSSPEALRNIYEEFQVKVSFTLPDETKQAIFDGIFKMTADALTEEDKKISDVQRQKRADRIEKDLKKLFDDGVVSTIRGLVIKEGKGTIDINIREAIEKELQLTEQILPVDDDYEKERIRYEKEIIQRGFSMAAPMFSVKKKDDFTETVYLALNPRAAEKKGGEPDAGATESTLVGEATAATDYKAAAVLMDEDFSRYEIICFRLKHNYCIEDLTKFSDRSEFVRAYNERIANLNRAPVEDGPDAFKTVVTPHLNRYWHEEGFIPSLGIEKKAKAKKEIRKAFIYAMGIDLFVLLGGEDTGGRQIWCLRNVKGTPVRIAGRLIKSDYASLYNSLKFNGKIVKFIKKVAEKETEIVKGFNDPAELINTVKETPFIQDLVQGKEGDGYFGNEEDMNILDIFYKMYPLMKKDEWGKLFDGLETALFEYLGRLFEDEERLINKAYVEIIDLLLANSKDVNAGDTAASRIRSHMAELKRKRYI